MNNTTQNIIKDLRAKFTEGVVDVTVKSEVRATIHITGEWLVNVAEYLYSELKFRFIIASALESKRGFEIYYHFSNDPTGLVMNLQVILPKDKPEVESLTGLFEAADWIEREMRELLGITFLNHPNPAKLISEGNWAEGVYPLRKEKS